MGPLVINQKNSDAQREMISSGVYMADVFMAALNSLYM